MTKRKIFLVKKTLLAIVVLVITGEFNAKGQCIPQVRKYATVQQEYKVGATITSPNAAVDGNPQNFSTLSVPLGVLNIFSATQYLEITSGANYIPANTPVTIKLSLPISVLGVIDNVGIQATKNLRFDPGGLLGAGARYIADNVGPSYSGSSLLNLLNGSGEVEITITPTSQYQGVSINVGSVLGVAVTAKVYHAYIYQDGSLNSNCNNGIDVLSGIRSGTAVGGIASATGQVNNPLNAIDADLNTFTTLDVGAQILSEVFHTTVFKTLAQPGDAVQMIIQKPEGGLLDLNLLNGFSVRIYNGSTAVGSAFSATSGLSLSLLPGSTTGNEKYTLTIQVPKSAGAFDRIELKMGGVATVGLTPGIRIYDVKHIILPKIAINGLKSSSTTLCLGNTAALSVSELQDCTTYKWYKVSTGGAAIHTGTSAYTPSASTLIAGPNVFYVEASRTNCTETSGRIPVTINIDPLPTFISTSANVCKGIQSTTLNYTGTNLTPAVTYSINWSPAAQAVGFTNVTNAILTSSPLTISVPNGVTPTIYSGSLTVTNGNTCTSVPTTISIAVHPKPLTPQVAVQ
jgi:hypothetical protein